MTEPIIQDAEAQVTELNDECERLRARVKDLEAAYANNLVVLGDTTRQLAERDATIARLREALVHIEATARPWPIASWDDLANALRRASEHAKSALAEQQKWYD